MVRARGDDMISYTTLGTFYAAYFRDLDGNKVALVRM